MAAAPLRAIRPLPRWSLVLAVLAALACAWAVGTRGMSRVLAAPAPAQALAWYSGNAEALVRINERERDPARKVARARRILARQPLEGRAYRQLAEVADAAGKPARALALYFIAARHSPRDRLSRAWLADHAYAQGRPGAALAHIDALLRMDAALREPVFERMALLASDGPFRAALVALLGTGPEWRAQFLAWWETRPGPDAARDAVHDALAGSGTAFDPKVRAARVERLLREQRWGEAARLRVEATAPPAHGVDGAVVNGGFDQEPAAGSFDWRLEEGARHRTGIVGESDGNRALRVELLGPGLRLGEIRQLLALAPGRYVVSLRVRLDRLRAERGLVAGVWCAGAATPLARSPALHGSAPWRSVSFGVQVPGDCPAQWLRIGLAAPAMDGFATGVAWFDDFAVRPLAGTTPAAAAPPPEPAVVDEAVPAAAPAGAGFHEAVARALAALDDPDDRDAPFGP